MIQQQTKLKTLDNSGAKLVKCIKVLGGFKRTTARLGDIIVVSVINLRNKSKVSSKVKKRRGLQSAYCSRKKKKAKERRVSFFS